MCYVLQSLVAMVSREITTRAPFPVPRFALALEQVCVSYISYLPVLYVFIFMCTSVGRVEGNFPL
jgi:hypothetical protein